MHVVKTLVRARLTACVDILYCEVHVACVCVWVRFDELSSKTFDLWELGREKVKRGNINKPKIVVMKRESRFPGQQRIQEGASCFRSNRPCGHCFVFLDPRAAVHQRDLYTPLLLRKQAACPHILPQRNNLPSLRNYDRWGKRHENAWVAISFLMKGSEDEHTARI